MMTTLYLNAPQHKAHAQGKRSFAKTLHTAVGDGYAIPKADAAQCLPGCRVVLLCQDRRQRAEGRLKTLKETGEKTGSGMRKYDVYIEALAEVPYSPPPSALRRTGILVVTG